MDPISFYANIIAVLGAAKSASTAFEKLLSLRNVPEQILQMINEISDLRTVLESTLEACQSITDNGHSTTFFQKVQDSASRAEEILQQINDIIQKSLIRNYEVIIRDLRTEPDFSWKNWMKERNHLRRLATSLREIRTNLTTKLTVLTASNVPLLRANLQEICLDGQETKNDIRRQQLATDASLHELQESIRDVSTRMESLQVSGANATGQDHGQIMSTSAGLLGHQSRIRVQTSLRTPGKCNAFCRCRCHKTSKFQSPEILNKLIGSLFIGYSGVPIPVQQISCNEKMCKKSQDTVIKFYYYFPTWFIGRVIAFRNHYNPLQGNSISIRTPRSVSPSSPVFIFANKGNINLIQKLFSENSASPFDVAHGIGTSILHVAIAMGRVELCEYLLQENADPNHEANNFVSCKDAVWTKLLEDVNGNDSRNLRRVFSRVLDPEEDLKKRNFTVLHRIVLGLSPMDLRSQLEVSTSEIDVKCSIEKTPLYWAIARSDITAIQTLLEYNADVFLTDGTGLTALHQAAKTGNPKVVEILLHAASLQMSAAPNTDFRASLSNGQASSCGYADVRTKNLNRDTPLLILSSLMSLDVIQCLRIAQLLTVHGADLDACNSQGICALAGAIAYNTHSIITYLLEQGASVDLKDNDEESLLHYLAGFGDEETMSIFQRANISGISTMQKNKGNETPLESFYTTRPHFVHEDDSTKRRCEVMFLEILGNIEQQERLSDEVVDRDDPLRDITERGSAFSATDDAVEETEHLDEFFDAHSSFEVSAQAE